MAHMRTITAAYAEIKAADPNTTLTSNGLRTLVLTGAIPSIRLGVKYVVNMDVLEAFLGMIQAEGGNTIEKEEV